MGSSSPGSFVLQVTPELMLKIASEQQQHQQELKQAPARRHKKPQQRKQQLVPDLGQGIPQGSPYLPGIFRPGILPGSPSSAAVQKDPNLDAHEQKIAAYTTLLEKTEKLASELQKRGAAELDEINQRAQELNNKQYRAPIRSIPCVREREACVQCYKENGKEPLKCKESADAFLECARRAQKELASGVL